MALEMRHDKMSVTILLTAGHAKERRQGAMTVWILTRTGHGNMSFDRLLLGHYEAHCNVGDDIADDVGFRTSAHSCADGLLNTLTRCRAAR